jgi:hypothetical protein
LKAVIFSATELQHFDRKAESGQISGKYKIVAFHWLFGSWLGDRTFATELVVATHLSLIRWCKA